MKFNLLNFVLNLFLCCISTAQDTPTVILANNKSLGLSVNGPFYNKADTLVIGGQTHLFIEAVNTNQRNDIRYTVNDGSEQHYKSPLHFKEEGFYVIKYFLKNRATPANNLLLLVDNTGPQIDGFFSYINIPVSPMFSKSKEILLPCNSVLNIKVTDDRSGPAKLSYQFDESPAQVFDGSLRLVARGNHTLRITATDLVGNQTQIPALNLIIEKQ